MSTKETAFSVGKARDGLTVVEVVVVEGLRNLNGNVGLLSKRILSVVEDCVGGRLEVVKTELVLGVVYLDEDNVEVGKVLGVGLVVEKVGE